MNEYVKKIIDLYTNSTLGKPAQEEFHKWLVDDDFIYEKEEALELLWDETENTPSKETIESLAQLKTKMHLKNKQNNRRVIIWKYAAVITLIICLTSVYLFTRQADNEIHLVEFSSGTEMKSITLPDGSSVKINAKTLILYPEDFGKKTRTLFLVGEANFKVAKNEKIPFVVRSKDFSVTALGTEFDVSSYWEDQVFKTTLISGSIKITQGTEVFTHVLKPTEQFAYHIKEKTAQVSEVDLVDETAWQRNELVFPGYTIEHILQTLERKFGLTFQYKQKSLSGDKYNFRFRKESTLKEILEIIKSVDEHFDYQIVNEETVFVRQQ